MGAPGDDLLPQGGGADMTCTAGGTGNGGIEPLAFRGVARYINIANPFTG